jgi:hypothetical protein
MGFPGASAQPSSSLWGRSIAPPPRRGSEPVWFFAWSVAESKKPNAPKTPDMPLGMTVVIAEARVERLRPKREEPPRKRYEMPETVWGR